MGRWKRLGKLLSASALQCECHCDSIFWDLLRKFSIYRLVELSLKCKSHMNHLLLAIMHQVWKYSRSWVVMMIPFEIIWIDLKSCIACSHFVVFGLFIHSNCCWSIKSLTTPSSSCSIMCWLFTWYAMYLLLCCYCCFSIYSFDIVFWYSLNIHIEFLCNLSLRCLSMVGVLYAWDK